MRASFTKPTVNGSFKAWCNSKNCTDKDFDASGKLVASIHQHGPYSLVWERGVEFDEIHVTYNGDTKFYN